MNPDHMTWLNVNAVIGSGAYQIPDFPDILQLLNHMDYLGVDRSLVWHIEARDLNPCWGNKHLLQQISDAHAQDRLIPAFAVTPACYYENGTMDFLHQCFSQHRVRALRIFPEMARFALSQIERVLADLAPYQPVVLWDCPTFPPDSDWQALIDLAQKFPKIHFIITQKMWPGFTAVLDAMWRCPNIAVDISWLHMRDTIELITNQFGPERLVFGLGYKSHYGAALASLAHARISDTQREMIAHTNIEHMLHLDPLPHKLTSSSDLIQHKPLWNTFRRGKMLTDVPIIDAHSHTGPTTRGWVLPETDPEENAHALIDQMNRLGIQRMIVCPETALFGPCLKGNLDTAALLNTWPQRFSGYVIYNPFFADEMLPNLDKLFTDPFFVGFKLLPSYWKIPLTDPRFLPVWQYAHNHHLPILLHTWDDSYNSPVMLETIVHEHPHANFILGHSGGGTLGRFQAEALAQKHPNVFLEFCGSFTTPRPFETSAKIVGWDRVIFGTDTGAHSAAWELGRYLSLPVPDTDLTPGLAPNIQRLLDHRRP